MNELDLFDIDSMISLYNCPSCGSNEFDHSVCIYCGNENKELQTKTIELIELIKKYTYFKLTPNLIKLYGLKDILHLEGLEEFLEKYHIKEEIEKKNKEIITKLLKEETLTLEENDLTIVLLQNNLIPDFPSDYVIRNALLNRKLVSLDLFQEIIKVIVVYAMKSLGKDKMEKYEPVCEIRKMDALGEAIGVNRIGLNPEVIISLYNGEAIYLQTIFHELTHIKQNIKIKTGYIDEQTVRYIKENVINFVSKQHKIDYYRLAYFNLALEIDADLEGFTYFRRYLQAIGINSSQILIEYIKKELKRKENTKINTENYDFINDNEIEFEKLFLICLNHNPEILKVYPQLQVEYIVEGNMIRRKNKEELQFALEHSTRKDEKAYLQKRLLQLEETPKRS